MTTSTLSMLKRDIARAKSRANLSPEDILPQARAARAGDTAARDRLAAHYAPMVLRLAGNLANEADNRGSTIMDLFQAGMLAAIASIRSYRPDRGLSLSTWIYPKVLTYMRREIEGAAIVRNISEPLLPFGQYTSTDDSDMDIADLAQWLTGESGEYSEPVTAPDTAATIAEAQQFLDATDYAEPGFDAWLLNCVYGMPVRDIGLLLGISKSQASRQVRDYSQLIRDRIQRGCDK